MTNSRYAAVASTERGVVDVSVIIPVYNDAERLGRCLSALDAQTFSGSYEVIVVDNGSTDDPACVVSDHASARIVREERPGSYVARNRGLEAASGGVIAFTDADCIPDRDWLERSIRAVRDHDQRFVVGRVELFARDPCRPTAVELWELNHAFQQELRVRRMSYGATANLIVPRKILNAVGHFDPALRSGGDKEWGVRATAAGYPAVYVDDVVVQHPARATWKELRAKYLRISAGKRDVRQRAEFVTLAAKRRRPILGVLLFLRDRWAEARHLGAYDRLRYFLVALVAVTMRTYDALRLTLRPRAVR